MKTKMVTQDLRRKIVLCALFLILLASSDNIAFADPNSPNPAPIYMAYGDVTPDFDPNAYSFLVYDCGTDNHIQDALPQIGIKHFTLRTPSNPVTAIDLATHDILIVSWNAGGNTSGLSPAILQDGITGRVFLTGHDLDYHTVNGTPHDQGDFQPADIVLSQAIEFVLAGGGTGLVGLTDPSTVFAWLPSEWGISAAQNGTEQIQSFTADGIASGVFDGIEPADMSGWSQSYHNTFTAWGDGFTSFELGASEHVVTIAAPINPMGFDLKKYDDIPEGSCVNINDPIEYTVTWNNTTDQTFYDAYIRDVLPVGVTYPVTYSFDPNTWEMVSSDPLYQEDHTYLYPIGTLSPNESGYLYLDVIVNSAAEPGYKLRNVAELWATVYDPNGQNPEERLIATAFVDTLACCWDTNGILYVDKNATGSNTGVSWENAYTSLDSALMRAKETQCTFDYVIYVAQGTYAPTNIANGFVLPDNVSVYGGFPTGGCDFADRNAKRYETILSGLIDEITIADKTVSMGDETLLDGVTVTGSFEYGVYGNGVDFALLHSIVKENFGYGIYTENGNVSVRWTTIRNNGRHGLYHEGAEYNVVVSNSWILRNGAYGLYTVGSTLDLKNSIISESSLTEQGRQGVRIENPKYQPKIINATIANNKAEALYFQDDGDADGNPNNPDYPDLQNSILFYNGGSSQITGFNPDVYANFCCIQDCNTVGTTNFPDVPGFAYQAFDPNGVPDPSGVPDPNNYHLAANSVCIDRANPFLDYTAQVDIDGEGLDRKYGDYVDVGADEVYDCDDDYISEADVHNDLDWDADGIVNLVEFNSFSRAWLSRSPNEYTDPNLVDPNAIANWNPKCNLANTGSSQFVIDLDDLELFLQDWLWIACWKLEEINAMTAMMVGGEEQMQVLSAGFVETEALQMISEPEMIQPRLTVEDQILQLQDAIEFLEQIWLEEPDLQQEINAEDWQMFMDAVYQNLVDLQTETVQIE